MKIKMKILKEIHAFLIFIAFFTAILCGCKKGDDTPKFNYGSITDQDGNSYKTITIGKQTWMAENLRTTKYNDGTSIQIVTDNRSWSILFEKGACCAYKNTLNQDTIITYGRLYNWYAVNTGKLAPVGWHVATENDFVNLRAYLGNLAGGKMKATDTTYWRKPNGGATNESGFNAIPGGRRSRDGTFCCIGGNGVWWTSSVQYDTYNTYSAWFYELGSYNADLGCYFSRWEAGFSVRCVRNNY